MGSRSRNRDTNPATPGYYLAGYYPGGHWLQLGDPWYGSSHNTHYEVCDDVTMAPPYVTPHPLFISKREVTPLRYYGEAQLGSFNVQRHYGYNPTNWTHHSYIGSAPAIDWNYWKAKALASINPFKPVTDVPLFLFELREFPSMLRDLGHVLQGRKRPRDVAQGYLAYNFGWAPLIGDLGKLIDFGESVANSRRNLVNAAHGRKIKRRVGSKSTYGAPQIYSVGFGGAGTWQLSYRMHTKITAWTTARVELTEPLPSGNQELDWMALRAAFGLHLNPSTLWNAVPWSWMIDYFTNIGALMEARNGYGRWRFRDMCLMVRTSQEEEITHALNKVGTMTFSGGRRSYIRKERSYIGSNPNVSIGLSPFLSGHQMSMLGALATARALRG